MSEEVEIEIKLNSTWHNYPPVYEILLDNVEIERGFVKEKLENFEFKSIFWKGMLDDSEHTLTIKLKGKNIGTRHTIVDDAGNITNDQLLHIEGISLDQIEIGSVAVKNSVFYPDNSEKSNLIGELRNVRTMGYNGDWTLKFKVPTYMWLLENM